MIEELHAAGIPLEINPAFNRVSIEAAEATLELAQAVLDQDRMAAELPEMLTVMGADDMLESYGAPRTASIAAHAIAKRF